MTRYRGHRAEAPRNGPVAGYWTDRDPDRRARARLRRAGARVAVVAGHDCGDRGGSRVTTAAHPGAAPAEKRRRPLWLRLVMYALIVVVFGAAANLLGWDIRGWFHSLWNTITTISVGVADRGDPPDDRADHRDGVRVVLDPPLRVSRSASKWQRHPRRLRRLGRAERDPAGEHRHARVPDHAHRSDRDQLRRGPRRLRGGEDLLHGRRRLRLPLSLPLGRRLVRHLLQLGARALACNDHRLRRVER